LTEIFQNGVNDIAQAKSSKSNGENKILNKSKQLASQNDWSNILMTIKLKKLYGGENDDIAASRTERKYSKHVYMDIAVHN